MGNAVIFSGTTVKTLKNTIDLAGTSTIAVNTSAGITVDAFGNGPIANSTSLLLDYANGKFFWKGGGGSGLWFDPQQGNAWYRNLITNSTFSNSTYAWTYGYLQYSVTFQDTGDTVTLNNHGLTANDVVVFTVITSTTGISINTTYYVVNPTTNTFQLATSAGGAALPLTTNGTGTMRCPRPLSLNFGTTTSGSSFLSSTTSSDLPAGFSTAILSRVTGAFYQSCGLAAYCKFNIKTVDLGKTYSITFDYKFQQAQADGDFKVYIHNIDTNEIITPTNPNILGLPSSTVGGTYNSTFQMPATKPASGLNIIIYGSKIDYNNTTFAISFTNVSVSPIIQNMGCPATDWTAYTPTLTSSTGTITNCTPTGVWRRVGDTLEVQFQLQWTGAAGTWTIPLISLPTGLVINTAKFAGTADNTTNTLGQAGSVRWGASNQQLIVRYASTTTVTLMTTGAAGTYIGPDALVTSTIPVSWGSNDVIYGSFRVPITGWSSNVLMSSSTAQNVVSAAVNNGSGAAQSISASTWTKVTFNTVNFDTTGSFDAATNYRYTAPVSGVYCFTGSIMFTAPSSASTVDVALYKNGAALKQTYAYAPTGTNASCTFSFEDNSVSGDYYEIYVRCGQATTILTSASVTGGSQFNIQRISGPAQIAAQDTVAASYTGSTSTTGTNNSYNVIKYSTKVYDTTGSYDTATGKYTVPVNGKYRITGSINAQITASGAGPTLFCAVLKNSTSTATNGNGTTAVNNSANYYMAQFTTTLNCVTGDVLYIGVNNSMNTTDNISLNNDPRYTYFCIERVGN